MKARPPSGPRLLWLPAMLSAGTSLTDLHPPHPSTSSASNIPGAIPPQGLCMDCVQTWATLPGLQGAHYPWGLSSDVTSLLWPSLTLINPSTSNPHPLALIIQKT